MVLTLADAVAIFNKWKDDSPEILVVTESPFQQSRRGVVEQSIDWALGLQGRVSEVSIDPNIKGKKAGTMVLEAPGGKLSLSIGLCTFVYEEPQEAKPVVREKPNRQPFQRSRCSFRQTKSLYSTNYANR